ncbi:ESF1 homolog [Hyposmocoma kahamanoa]|uniref:ESF1 homolog n=1 Tax=Hyposmocoma kahamanoa TaxID=1477025 RepID=UPI000E6D86D2|nr:ESF1 homolog [Hyposmocoma kahamanoa]
MGDILKDSRFGKYLNDPRYRQIPKYERKVKIDKRFQSMFKDEKFKVKYTVDKRGRPLNETSTENLRKFYELEESAEESENSDEEVVQVDKDIGTGENEPGRFVKRPSTPSGIEEEDEKSPKLKNDKLVRGKLDKKTKEKLQDLDVDYARGEGILQTDSSSEEESSNEEEDSDVEHKWGELDADADSTEESAKRIAICNMDWDNIKATDIMVLLHSFLPAGGIIHKVTIYPSEYGLKRMQEEEIRGPIELTEEKVDEPSDNEENEEGSTYHMEKLRRYQLNRLKYYYAVVECDSVTTADKLYSECDSMEYESSATKIDMRFIPDDVSFDQEPREVCTNLPDLTKYKPRLFTTTALQQAKVELTWDATNPNRAEAIRSALDGKIDDLDLNDYLASSSEDENSEEENKVNEEDDPIKKYIMLLEDIEKKEDKKNNKDMEMEITWGLGIKDKAEELVKKKMNEDDKDLTPFEKILKKRKEKQKQKKLQKQKSEAENDDSNSEGSSDDVPSDIDMNDPYFAEEFNNSEFKKAKCNNKKKYTKELIESAHEEEQKRNAELELLLDEEDGKSHFSLKKIQEAENISKKSKRKKKLKEKMAAQQQALPEFEINVNDQRFSALYTSHLYNIDPTDSNFKKTKNMEKLIQEKLKRRPADTPPNENEKEPKKSRDDVELNLLVKNLKRKTKDVSMNK